MSSSPTEKSDPFGTAHSQGTRVKNYRSFLVRIWREAEDAPWRASITDVLSKESLAFGTLQALFLHLHKQIENQEQDK